MRGGVRARQEGRAGGHRPAGALRRRLGGASTGLAEPSAVAAAQRAGRVAVVGSGPAGLTVRRRPGPLGHEVTIFEALHEPGGVLVYGIPEFRLPKAIVRREVEYVEQPGRRDRARTSSSARRARSTSSCEELDAVFVGTGAGLPWFMDIPGENLNGVYSANEYLTRVQPDERLPLPRVRHAGHAAAAGGVVGGGNVAMDSARTALRLGADEVHIVYRRTRDEMPARARGGRARRGGGRHLRPPHAARSRLLGDEQRLGRRDRVPAHGARRARRLGPPPPDRRSRAPSSVMPIDALVCAIGNSPNPLIPMTTPGPGDAARSGNIVADEASRPHVPRPASGPAATSSPARRP